MKTNGAPLPGKGRLRIPALPPWHGAPRYKLAVPRGDSDGRYWRGPKAPPEACFKLGLQGRGEQECGKLMAKLPSQHTAGREGPCPARTSPFQHGHLAPWAVLPKARPGQSGPLGSSASSSEVWFLFPKSRKSVRYTGQETKLRVSSLGSGPGCSTPLSPSLPPALSLASPRSCFSQGQTPPTPTGDKLLWACGNILPKTAGLTAQRQRWVLWPLRPLLLTNPKQGWGETTLPTTPGHSLPRPQKIDQELQGWRRLDSLNPSQLEVFLGELLTCQGGSKTPLPPTHTHRSLFAHPPHRPIL